MLDLAPDLPPGELDEMVRTCLERGLFTVEQACERMVKPDMILRPGPALLTDSLTRIIGWR